MRWAAASDVYKRQDIVRNIAFGEALRFDNERLFLGLVAEADHAAYVDLTAGNVALHAIDADVAVADDLASRKDGRCELCLLYTSPSPRDRTRSRMPSSA